MTDRNKVDIKENDVLKYDNQLLTILLKDNSTKQNIIWATDNYVFYGYKYTANEPKTASFISGERGSIIKPRVERNTREIIARVRDKVEVFTPSWICNIQNNFVDKPWFEAENIYNIELVNGRTTQICPIPFPSKTGKTLQDYVLDERLKVSCGEAYYFLTDDEITFRINYKTNEINE